MRKVSLFTAASLDGFIAKKDGGIDWLFTDADYGYASFYRSVDAILMGRKTYQQTLSFSEFPHLDKPVYVFTRRRGKPDFPNVRFINNSPAAFVRDLKNKKGKTIWLVGGGLLNGALLEAGLIDEIVLSIHPVALGMGVPLFAGARNPASWNVVKTKKYQSGLVQITYRR